MKRADFDWRPVIGALAGADLSGRYDERGYPRRASLPPAWPSREFAERHRDLSRNVVAPERKKKRDYGITVGELEAEIDWLFSDLARTGPHSSEIARRWEEAAVWLVEAKRRAQKTRIGR